MVASFYMRKGRRFNKAKARNGRCTLENRNHKTQPLFEVKRFIISLGFFFLMKR